MQKNVKILDCTFRDGGHLLNWNFNKDTVERVMTTISNSGIDYFEIGYRSNAGQNQNRDIGPYALCNEDYLYEIKERSGLHNLTVMMDVGKSKKSNFILKSNSSIDCVRVATYAKDIDLAIEHAEDLLDKGYEVFINLMALTHVDKKDLVEIINKIDRISSDLEAIYFADSFGSMFPNDVGNIVSIIKDHTDSRIGFHGHNNLQMAFSNSLSAIESGAEYIDSTLYGQGRGAGNLPTEILCAYLNSINNSDKFNLDCLVSVIQDIFLGCANKVDWGYSLESFITGVTNSHPNSFNELESDNISLLDGFIALKENIK